MFHFPTLHSTTRGLRGDEERLSQEIALLAEEGDAAIAGSYSALYDDGSTVAGSGAAEGGMALAWRWSGAAACLAAAAGRGAGMTFFRSGTAGCGSDAAFSGWGTAFRGSGIKPSREETAGGMGKSRGEHGNSDTGDGEGCSRGTRSCAGGGKCRSTKADGCAGERPNGFPLTPTLSPGERETEALPRQGRGILFTSERQLVLLPLAAGEGWGEGVAVRRGHILGRHLPLRSDRSPNGGWRCSHPILHRNHLISLHHAMG